MRRALAAALLGSACVFPAYDLTGIEFSWLFVESNLADGETGTRVRTCTGASATDISITIADRDDPERMRTFPHACATGYQTVDEFQLEPSDVFITLSPGEYDITTQAISKNGVALARDEQTVSVGARGVTVVALDLPLPVVDWTLNVQNVNDCTDLGLRMVYAGPDDALASPPSDTDGETLQDVLYRENLRANTDLSLSGEPIACGAAGGIHTVPGIDIGEYRLLVDVDGVTCPLALRIDRPDLQLNLDLENLPCAG